MNGADASDVLLDVGKRANVQRWVGERGVQPRQVEYGEEGVDERHHHQVPVVRGSFLQPASLSVFGWVDFIFIF